MSNRSLRVLSFAFLATFLMSALLVDPSDTTWVLEGLSSKASAKAKGIGKLKFAGALDGSVDILEGGLFTADLDGTEISGTWTRKSPKSKRLDLVPDAESITALEERYESDIETLAPVPLDTDLTLDLEKSTIKVKIKPKKKAGTVRTRAMVKLRFSGVTTGQGLVDRPTKVKASIKGISNEQALAPLLVDA